MSRVFAATDNTLHRRVAVKVLAPELAAALSVDRFEREIALSAGLQHPNIVPVLTAGVVEGLPFYTMPFVDGESLRARLARGPFSVREAVIVLRDVSRALAYAHSRGVVHRDIKPDNILLPSGAATVTDFGLAKAVGASKATAPKRPAGSTITRTGTSIGTPAYMAPEQVAGDPALDHRADLYSLGIVAYEMLMGAPPFSGRTPQQVLAAHLTERPAPIATRRYDVPAKLVELIERLLAKDPADRPKAAIEVARLLETPDVVSGTFATLRRRRPVRLWRWIALAVTASMVGGALWWRTFAR
jgi:serine/threonine-protein kinase